MHASLARLRWSMTERRMAADRLQQVIAPGRGENGDEQGSADLSARSRFSPNDRGYNPAYRCGPKFKDFKKKSGGRYRD